MATKRVVVSGGGDNLFRVTESSGKFLISQVDVGLLTNNYNRIGQTRSFDDALNLIKSFSGQRIDKITDW
ncbi:MAG: hypothetical protein WDZ45_11250 [Flavobacteriaceae bacterium]